MSTLKLLGGKQYADLRQKRIDAMKFFQSQTRLPPPMGFVAAAVLQTLRKVHEDPTLNGYDKDREFKRVIQAGHAAGAKPVAAVSGVPEAEVGRDIPAGSGSDEPAAP